MRDSYPLKRGWKVLLKEGQEIVGDGEVIATRGKKKIRVETGGRVIWEEDSVTVAYEDREEREYQIPSSAH